MILLFILFCNFSKVAEYLELKDTDLDLTSAVILDYFVGGLWWSREQSYTAEQTSAFYTVIDTLFRNLGTYLSAISFPYVLVCYNSVVLYVCYCMLPAWRINFFIIQVCFPLYFYRLQILNYLRQI